eukprot:CAMPEP_0117444546 /NCGR_PEP_ID=MMETSP0759-20121206/5299_1 /TAXON_ID=63605 /ORGANISM="Percolomonas cosmopolitus, Strain WS" /LENGTH=1141 /DNA_ID=CAMNT_0005236621 /DNA_START=223 /DNA_END=3648 /DNA_ORIENTATION=+
MDTLSQSTDAYVTISLGGLPSSRLQKEADVSSSYVSSSGVFGGGNMANNSVAFAASQSLYASANASDRSMWSNTSSNITSTSSSSSSSKSGTITKTPIDRRTLNPTWNYDFRYELASSESLQDYTLDFKVWDHDYVSSDDIIGSVVIVIDCASLQNRNLEGWFPIWDTVKGIRGELHLSIKVESLGNVNPWKEDSENVRIYGCKDLRVFEELGRTHGGNAASSSALTNNPTPHGGAQGSSSFRSSTFTSHPLGGGMTSTPSTNSPFTSPIIGDIVEELLVDRDHTWIDTFRSSRTSNEQRQQLFYNLSGRMRRKIGKKAREMGFNAVIGYRERFDLDKDENGITVRGIGTMAHLPWLGGGQLRHLNAFTAFGGAHLHASDVHTDSHQMPTESPHNRSPHFSSTTGSWSHSPTKYSPTKQGSGFGAQNQPTTNLPTGTTTAVTTWKNADIKLCTMKQFEKYRIKRLGGLVTAKSVKLSNKTEKNRKLLGKIHDSWWHELRDEIKSHARMLHCSHVIGYEENMYIYRDVCVLWASGTAAVLRHTPKRKKRTCKLLHVTYPVDTSPFYPTPQNPDDPTSIMCDQCERYPVPEILLTSIETPEEVITRGESVFIEAHVVRKKKKKSKDEELAIYISNLLVFIEFDLHKQLCYKLKLYGMNMAMNYKMDIAICQDSIVFTCSVQAFRAIALPKPTPLEFNRVKEVQDSEDVQMLRVQQHLERISVQNIRKTDHAATSIPIEESDSDSSSSSDDEREDDRENDPSVVEIHDDADEDQMACLLASAFPPGVQVSSLSTMVPHGTLPAMSNFQHIVLTKRFELDAPLDKINQHLTALYNDMYRELAYRMEPFVPCLLAGIQNKIEFFDRELQIQTSVQAILLEEGSGVAGGGNDAPSTTTTDTDTEEERFEELRPLLLDQSMENIYQSLYDHFKEEYYTQKREATQGFGGPISTLETPVSDEIFQMDTHEIGASKHHGSDTLPNTSSPPPGAHPQPHRTSSTLSSNLESLDELLKTTTSFYSRKDNIDQVVHVTPLSFVPGHRVKKLHNRLYLHFLREADNITDPSSFLEDVYCDIKNIIQARTRAERANAVLGFEIFEHNVVVNRGHKQAFLTCSGDIAEIEPLKSTQCEHLGMGMEAISSIGAQMME